MKHVCTHRTSAAIVAGTFTALVLFSVGSTPVYAQSTSTQGSQTETAGSAAYATKVPVALMHLGVSSNYYSPHAFVVDKKARTLTVWAQDAAGYRQIAQFPADLGKKDGDKTSSGDHRTPEGVYFLLDRLEGPSLDFSQYGKRAFTTDYPNFFDRRDGKTGHGIWLHAVPDQVPLTRGSRGCVVVRNDVILDLTQYVRLSKTPILIEKEVDYVSPDELKTQSAAISQMIESWRTAWEKKDIDGYISHYGADFDAMKMNRDEWKRFKQGLNERYQQLTVRFSRPVILRYKDRIVARFLQQYTSDQHADFGEKTLYIRKTAEGYRIVGEEWAKDESRLAREELNSAQTVTACAPGTSKCQAQTAASTN